MNDFISEHRGLLEKLAILVVDDSKTSAQMLGQQLRQLEIKPNHIDCVNCYQQAMSQVSKRYYDIIFIDYHLEQNINGNELATLLYRRRLLSINTGIIFISSDATQTTVLTVLAGHSPYFLKKPFKTVDIGNKIIEVKKNLHAIQYIEHQLKEGKIERSTLDNILRMIDRSPSPILVENLILNSLYDDKNWPVLKYLIEHSSTATSLTKVFLNASIALNEGEIERSIEIAQHYLAKHPASPRILDQLVHTYLHLNNKKEALHYAQKSFDLTPSVNSRAVMVCRIATELNLHKTVLKVGMSFTRHLSIIDVGWVTTVSIYCDCIKAFYHKYQEPANKQELKLYIFDLLSAIRKRLTSGQKRYLDSYQLLMKAYFSLEDQDSKNAKLFLYKSISPFYDHFDSIPSIVMTSIIPIAVTLGEVWLVDDLMAILQKRDKFDAETQQQLQRLYSNIASNSALTELREHLAQNKRFATDPSVLNQSSELTQQYQAILNHYPHCSEAQVGFIFSIYPHQSSLNADKYMTDREIDSKIKVQAKQVIDELSVIALPSCWQEWASLSAEGKGNKSHLSSITKAHNISIQQPENSNPLIE